MTRRTALVGLTAWTFGCGAMSAPAPFSTELTAPWTDMALPIEKGRVVYSDGAMLTVHYDGAQVAPLTASWSSALAKAGLIKGSDTSSDDMTSVTWSSDAAVIALGVLAAEGRAEVSLTAYPRQP